MFKYIAKRSAITVLVVFAVASLTFLLLCMMPGDTTVTVIQRVFVGNPEYVPSQAEIQATKKIFNRLVKNKHQEAEKVAELINIVGLKEEHMGRYPHELSGGELQRAMIARVLSLGPKFIVADEPTSMLDVSVQAQILNLLLDLQKKIGVSYLFITHDLEVARRISDQIAIMYAGQIVELAKTGDIFYNPLHPCTRNYLKSTDLSGSQSSCDLKANVVSTRGGCAYFTRCLMKKDCCVNERPDLIEIEGEHRVRCHNLVAAD